MAKRNSLIRLVYASTSTNTGKKITSDLKNILATASSFNPTKNITGLLSVTNGYFMQLLEGPPAAVDALFEKIACDPRHRDVKLLMRTATAQRNFPDWSLAVVERSETSDETAVRFARLVEKLALDPKVVPADFFRLMYSPNVNKNDATTAVRGQTVKSVVFVSPAGLWSAALLQRIASDVSARLGRTTLLDSHDASKKSLIEYADFDVPKLGPIRALSLTNQMYEQALVTPLIQNTQLLTLILAPSDLADFPANIEPWLAHPEIRRSKTEILLVSNLDIERLEQMAQTVSALAPGHEVSGAQFKLSGASGIWEAAQHILQEQIAHPKVAHEDVPFSHSTVMSDTEFTAEIAVANANPAVVDPVKQTVPVNNSLNLLLQLDGCLYAAALTTQPTSILVSTHPNSAEHVEILGDATAMRIQQDLIAQLALDDTIEDIAVTTPTRFKLFRPLRTNPMVFLCAIFRRDQIELAVARMQMRELEQVMSDAPNPFI
jgi:hypothetical protein